MSLRRKTMLLMTVTLAGLIMLLYVVLHALIFDGYSTLERQDTARNLTRAVNSVQDSADTLGRTIRDWSTWDDTYQFVQDGNADYIEGNLHDNTFRTLNINLMMFVNTSNEIVYGKVVDPDPTWQDKLLNTFETYLRGDERFFQLTKNNPTSGFLVLDDQPMLIAARPILHNDDSGPPAGTLIWVRHIGAQELNDMSQTLRLAVDLRSQFVPNLPPDFRQALEQITPLSSQSVIPLDDQAIAGYASLNNIYGQPTLLLRSSQDRAVYWQGQTSLNYFAAALVVVGVTFTVGVLLLLEWIILSPLQSLSLRVQQIGFNDDFPTRLPVSGSDELAQLAAAINTMLDTLAKSRDALYQSNMQLERGVAERTIELEQQKSQLQAIMDTMGEGLIYCVDDLIAYVNRAMVDLLNYGVADLVGKPFSLLNPQLEQANTPIFQKSLRSYQTTFNRSDGSPLNVAITSTPVIEADEHNRRVFIVRDITQELASKAQKDYFFARASHDLRSPLTSLMTRLYLLGKRPDQLVTHLKALNNVSNLMLELVNDLLEVSRLEQGELALKRRDLVLQTLIEQVVELQQADAEMKHIHLCAEMVEAPLRIYGDPIRLNQVVTNLVSNAIRYTDDGGSICVQVAGEDIDGVRCAVIRVVDTGIGISEKHLAHIFDAFFRVNDERGPGSGLGLYIVKEIVELHGGTITVSSAAGKGTTFTVILHLTDQRSAITGRMSA